MNTRRNFLKKTALISLAGATQAMLAAQKKGRKISFSEIPAENPFVLPQLPYSFSALEPFIDAKTMEIHHDKHHQAYVTNLNKSLEGKPFNGSINELCHTMDKFEPAIRNNGGGHYNHSLFWTLMKENKDGSKNTPSGKIMEAVQSAFGGFDNFKQQFSDHAMKRFGSGWAWLVKDGNTLKIGSTPNQDNPLMPQSELKGTPILCLDVWEHAYYLKYQNKRIDYVTSWFNLINWEKSAELFEK